MRLRWGMLLVWLVLASQLVSAQSAEVYFSDTFASVSGQRPRSWRFTTPDPLFWQVKDGWLATGNGDDLISPDGFSFAVIEAPGAENWSNYRIACRFYMKQTNGQVLLVARWADRQNHYRAAVEMYEGRHMLRLAKVVRGRVTEIGSQVLDLPALGIQGLTDGSPDKSIEFFLQVSGNRISSGLAGKQLLDVRDAEFVSGAAGVGEQYNEVFFDDVIVTADSAKDTAIRTVYHVEIARDVDIAKAADLQKQLTDKGLAPVFLRGSGSQVSVQQGNYLTETQAQEAMKRVAAAGFTPAGLVTEERGGKSDTSKSGEVFSVQLAETSDAAEAQALVSALQRQAYFPFVDTHNGMRRVLIGRFANRDEAQEMQARMVGEGFSFARVVDLGAAAGALETGRGKTGETAAAPAVPAEVSKTIEWQSLSPAQRDKVIEAVMMQRAARMQLQSVEEISKLKQTVESLSKKQVEILNKIASGEQQEEEKRRAVSRLSMAINRAQDARDWAGMKELIDQLEQIDPNSPLAVMKRNRLNHLMNNTWEGEDVYRQNQVKLAGERRGKADEYMRLKRYDDAMNTWHSILQMDGASEDLKKEASQKIDEIHRLLEDERQRQNREQARFQKLVVMGAVALGAFVVVMLIVGFMMGRARYNRMALQLREEAIAPLQALQQRSAAALGSSRQSGVSYNQAEQSLIEQAEAPDAEFMIPETGPAETPEPEIEPVVRGKDADDDIFGGPGREQSPVAIPVPGLDDDFSVDIEVSKPTPSPAKPAASHAGDSEDEFVFSFDDSKPDTASGSSVLPQAPVPGEADAEEDIVLSFDDGPTAAEPAPPARAPQAPAPAPQKKEEDIVFSFDDAVLDTDAKEASGAETILGEKPGADDSIYESIPLEDLNLDLGEESPLAADQTAPMAAAGAGPLAADSLDLNLDLDLPELNATDEENPLSLATLNPAAGIVFAQQLDGAPAGSTPDGWEGDPVAYASLEIAEDPDGSGGNCLRFSKTAGSGPTSFRRSFSGATGKFRIEYDIRCDEKNKHLLGFYVEQDNDFRRSVHTVVQCTDPLRPAHLRVFTRPTPYQLGVWSHVCYVVDLAEGMVDGYVNEELVAEGVRMGTKASELNTFAIRDDAETTGVLYIRNLVIARA